jgi:hypothetical protein
MPQLPPKLLSPRLKRDPESGRRAGLKPPLRDFFFPGNDDGKNTGRFQRLSGVRTDRVILLKNLMNASTGRSMNQNLNDLNCAAVRPEVLEG